MDPTNQASSQLSPVTPSYSPFPPPIQEIEEDADNHETPVQNLPVHIDSLVSTLESILFKKNPDDLFHRMQVCLQASIDLQDQLTNEDISTLWKRMIPLDQLKSIKDKNSWLYWIGISLYNNEIPIKFLSSWLQLLASLSVLSTKEPNPYVDVFFKSHKGDILYELNFTSEEKIYKVAIPLTFDNSLEKINPSLLNKIETKRIFELLIKNYITSVQSIPDFSKQTSEFHSKKQHINPSFLESILSLGKQLQNTQNSFLWGLGFELILRCTSHIPHPVVIGKLIEKFPTAISMRRFQEDQRSLLKAFETMLLNIFMLTPNNNMGIMYDLIDRNLLTLDSAKSTWITVLANEQNPKFNILAKLLWEQNKNKMSKEAKCFAAQGLINGSISRAVLWNEENQIQYALSIFMELINENLLDQNEATKQFSIIVTTVFLFKINDHPKFVRHLIPLCKYVNIMIKKNHGIRLNSDTILFEALIHEILKSDIVLDAEFLKNAIPCLKTYIKNASSIQSRLAILIHDSMPKIDEITIR